MPEDSSSHDPSAEAPVTDAYETIQIVSHELRSPLTSVRGFAKTLVTRWDLFDDAARQEMVAQIAKDADRLGRLVDELFDLARIESGRLKLTTTQVQLADVVSRIVARLPAGGREILLDGDATVSGDESKLEQVVTNLLENAIKYSPAGAVSVVISDAAAIVRLSVSDVGVALSSSEIPSLFEKFVRRDASPSGSGLGLYISRKLIEAHGGTLNAEVIAGKGTTFFFEIPR